MLSLYRRLLSLRRSEPALAIGSYTPVSAARDLLAYTREAEGRRFLILLNLGRKPDDFVPEDLDLHGRVALSTHPDRDGESVSGPIALRGDEGVVVELQT